MASPNRVGQFAATCALFALSAAGWPVHAHDDRTDRVEAREERRVREAERRQRDAQRERERESERSTNSGSQSGRGSSRDDGDHDEDRDDDRHDREDARSVIRAVRIDVTADAEGRERRRDEVLMVGRGDAVQAVRAAGYAIVGERALTAFAESLARIRVPAGVSVEQAIDSLRAIAPEAEFAPHHLFRASEGAARERGAASSASVSGQTVRIGVIDTGADSSWSPLATAIVRSEGFADGGYTPRSHGTLVAEVAAVRGAQLHIGDVFGVDSENRLVASAEAIAAAIHWMVADRVRVINISIEGPDNLVLAHVIKRAIAADTLIVAAAGNGGPGAKPVFPAAYPGVIAVTAIDEAGRVYRRANQGSYIAFAARGVRVMSSYPMSKDKAVSGTSFAAPIVAVALAAKLREHDASAAIAALRLEAQDLGDTGRDTIYGWGTIDK
jgi:subtilisin family serine protease